MLSRAGHPMALIQKYSGLVIIVGCIVFLLSLVPKWENLYGLSALCYWVVFMSAWPRLNTRNKRQIGVLLAIGGIALFVSVLLGQNPLSISLLEGNLGIVAMLTGVSLLGLLPDSVKKSSPSVAGKGVIHTWLSVHLLGSVINMSAIFLVGDKLQRQSEKMTMPQYTVLVRGLTSAGLWSPFFASIAVALSIAPDAEFHHLVLLGIPMALCSCLMTLWEFKRRDYLSTFSGFPIAVHSLLFPITLASLVIIFHYFILQQTPILAVVTLLSPLAVMVLLSVKYGLHSSARRLRDHIHVGLPNMVNVIALFLSAGFLTKAISLALASTLGNDWSLFSHFGFNEAILCFIVICLMSLLGLHPIVGISLMSSLVPATSADNTLLAFVSLSAWGVGTAISPLSGINLSIAGKYGVDNFALARSNWLYGAMMCGVVAVSMIVLLAFWD